MRSVNQSARDQLPTLLRRHPGASSTELAAWTDTSQPTISRIMAELGDKVIALGRGPRRRYYWRRSLRGMPGIFPLYAVDASGQVTHMETLHLIEPEGSVLDVAAMGWPVDSEFKDGRWPGLAYPLQDMRPQGFLGRSFARHAAADLHVSPNPAEWGDDDVLYILTQRGADTSGNLILGEAALQRWLATKGEPVQLIGPHDIEERYSALAQQAAGQGVLGSSAAGEFPKFTAMRDLPGSDTPHVIVKFSGDEDSGAVRRWADLLVCENLALVRAGHIPGVKSARSRVLSIRGRTLLEVERFDRHGLHGRSPLCSLETIDAALMGKSSEDWSKLAPMMHARGWISVDTALAMQTIWFYGKLINNSDMHKGNLSFLPTHPMTLAPVYDMLPMAYAPMGGGELPQVKFAPALPLPQEREAWVQACESALAFWEAAGQDGRISMSFREICMANHEELLRLRAVA